MKLQFKDQAFQADAAKAVCDVFAGQPFSGPTYITDPGSGGRLFAAGGNAPVVISDDEVLEHIRSIQRSGQIKPSDSLVRDGEVKYNLTIEMETGVGKTYTYIKTMYELNKHYGWSKFIIVVPSVAIREGVHKSFQMTEEHFSAKEEYGKKIRCFIYNSAQLPWIDHFASDSEINAMIINSQAFNARGESARRIHMELDSFRSRRPIDVLAQTNPILIIDEPQSVEGAATKERLKEFKPLMTLRYSATHKLDSVYNMIYRLDALDAYNKRLVKKIAVKGISVSGSTEGYIYVQGINLSKGSPTATIEFNMKGSSGIRKALRNVGEGYSLFEHSGELDEYKDGYTVLRIDGRDSSVEFVNGKKLFAGDVIGSVSDEQLRRIQIRETILSHIEREQQLYPKGIKVLSLFFIDEVAKYRQYDSAGKAVGGTYAEIFEEEYKAIVSGIRQSLTPEYGVYLDRFAVEQTHAGYFSIDKKSKRMIDSKIGDRKERTSDDVDAYDLIMKDKERLLGLKEPVRFIFSHSALREGWDNPNVFQICTLKRSGSDVRKRQEVGRGLRLSVDENGVRMDENALKNRDNIHNVNVLTVIANESYDSFAKGLQKEIAEAVGDRPIKVEPKLFVEKFGGTAATAIYNSLVRKDYVNDDGELTDKYYEAKKNGALEWSENVKDKADGVIDVLDSVYDPRTGKPEDARKNTVENRLNKDKRNSRAFKELWSRISGKSYYSVSFDEAELVKNSIEALDANLHVSEVCVKIERGEQADTIDSKGQLLSGDGFVKGGVAREKARLETSGSVRYDLVGKIVAGTGLTRKAVADILRGVKPATFEQFAHNPEEFIVRAAKIVQEQEAKLVIANITYNKGPDGFDDSAFPDPYPQNRVSPVNAMKSESKRHLYDYVICDSNVERDFASALEANEQDVEVYVKLPKGTYYIDTPVGQYSPDWAIAFHEGKAKHIYVVAETKGSTSDMDLRAVEAAKINCARKHFSAISEGDVEYRAVTSYDELLKQNHAVRNGRTLGESSEQHTVHRAQQS
ncbi:MAG: DEAD/DEAH box helicase family protein [Synergistaceae bacterium]|jgi:type III restriction enzyme|nr:DEAD/DEAH box helicase family protein [Synergistaceae bacterium]